MHGMKQQVRFFLEADVSKNTGGICRPCPIELRALELIVILRGQYW